MKHRRKKQNKPPLKIIALSSFIAISIFGFGYSLIEHSKFAIADKQTNCYEERIESVAVLVFDSSIFTDHTTSRDINRDVHAIFKDVFNQLQANEKLIVVTTEPDKISSVPVPRLVLCRPAKNQNELEAVGADPNVTQIFLRRALDDAYQKMLFPVVEDLLDSKHHQNLESPILEQLQSVSRLKEFSQDVVSHRRLILVSDLIENRPPIHFCTGKNHLPPFTKFKKTDYFERVKPDHLTDVDVEVFMVVLESYAQFAFCTENELRKFFGDYFRESGTRNPVFQRVLL